MRATPFYCPYCGDEDLEPHDGGGHGAWRCRCCQRAFELSLVGVGAGAADEAGVTP